MNKDELLRGYLEGNLSSEEEKRALHTIAEDEELRAMLRFEQRLNEVSLDESLDYDREIVPENFSAQVMQQIALADEIQSLSVYQQLKAWFRGLFTPKQIQWRPAYTFAMVVLALAAFLYPWYLTQQMKEDMPSFAENSESKEGVNGSVQQVSSGTEEVMLRFVYIDENANSMAVAGDFNDWEPVEMRSQQIDGKQVWTALVPMKRGEHHYMFVKNEDQWMTDPLATIQRDDGFGNKNAVIYL
ncbi:hypothetical protein [Fodinibius salsisoli]|uniref:AMP-activated protein kinase glycogen-binding domain-containing protein n=1 Tax=Fodinibius salsisoli TaxID=2820877 RepID=A0ABT3PTB6_9BACT|nr:hypothetical protein [Fodinibius salsisoli]MCW9709101.1 hypothetical protein [Fodinibius salsisoli]